MSFTFFIICLRFLLYGVVIIADDGDDDSQVKVSDVKNNVSSLSEPSDKRSSAAVLLYTLLFEHCWT